MRRLLVCAMAGGLLAAGAWLLPASAGHLSCSTGDQVNVPVPGVPGSGFSGGVVCGNGDPTNQTGYIYADGNEGNPEPLDGYIGANSDEGIVGCADGDYNDPHTARNVILDPSNPNPAPPNPDDPCSPKPPTP